MNAAQRADNNWINSSGHFQTMIDSRCDCIGVGVTQYDGITYCYMFVGIPNSVNFYAWQGSQTKEQNQNQEQAENGLLLAFRSCVSISKE